MSFTLPPLPYGESALAPYISAETVSLHYGKHHQGYLNKLNKAVKGQDAQSLSLEQLITGDHPALFNNAAQVWNHTFYWRSLTPNGGGDPAGKLLDAINRDFGSVNQCREQLSSAASGQFGSGWAWLVADTDHKLSVVSTGNAENPLQQGLQPLLTLDVWEHAYYVDYRNKRGDYVTACIKHLLNWDFAEENYTS